MLNDDVVTNMEPEYQTPIPSCLEGTQNLIYK